VSEGGRAPTQGEEGESPCAKASGRRQRQGAAGGRQDRLRADSAVPLVVVERIVAVGVARVAVAVAARIGGVDHTITVVVGQVGALRVALIIVVRVEAVGVARVAIAVADRILGIDPAVPIVVLGV
jgi:hypothetical protein